MNFFRRFYLKVFPASKGQIHNIAKQMDIDSAKFASILAEHRALLADQLTVFSQQIDTINKDSLYLISELIEKHDFLSSILENTNQNNLTLIRELTKKQEEKVIQKIDDSQGKILNRIQFSKEEIDVISKKTHSVSSHMSQLDKNLIELRKQENESIWAHIFHDTTTGSSWLLDKCFSPGRWATGYPSLYLLFRVLNEMSPLSILELGLGQSTRMIAQYAASNPEVSHQVVEHDLSWIEFFQNSFELPSNTKIEQNDLEMKDFNGASVRQFKDFPNTVANNKYDCIFIDAPLGSDMSTYARVDVAANLPSCLKESFAIIVDDYERKGEARMVDYIKETLNDHHILFSQGRYSGAKDVTILCSKNLAFLASM